MQILSRLQRLTFVQDFINILQVRGKKYGILSPAKRLIGNNDKHPKTIQRSSSEI